MKLLTTGHATDSYVSYLTDKNYDNYYIDKHVHCQDFFDLINALYHFTTKCSPTLQSECLDAILALQK